MRTRRFAFFKRLIDKITKSPSNNMKFIYYGHLVVLSSGTTDYVSATVYEDESRYSGELADFSFDYWTYELNINFSVSDRLEEIIIQAFRSIYGRHRVKVCEDE